jgi:hypothetical protein
MSGAPSSTPSSVLLLPNVLTAPVSAMLLVPTAPSDELAATLASSSTAAVPPLSPPGNASSPAAASTATHYVWLGCDDGCIFVFDPSVSGLFFLFIFILSLLLNRRSLVSISWVFVCDTFNRL